ncbi:phosphotransferase family protein [Nocardiopsis dassonvillei]|uniref:phosphotransferase family protein n=1 Tax=Nocardiopsis dassonvillei TaxID=2014 RepID=UPI00366AD3A9
MTVLAPLHGGFSERELHILFTHIGQALGADVTGAELLRGHTNVVLRLRSPEVVVKIARKGTPVSSVERTTAVVRWLMDHGFPTVPLHPGADQPLVIDGHPVTVWTYLPQHGVAVHAADLAHPLKELHSLPSPPRGLRGLDNIAAIRASLEAITALADDELSFLRQRLDRLTAALARVDFVLPPSVVQGDPQHRNALHDHRDGRTVLCDWDTLAWGQPEWDLVTLEIHCRRFGHGAAHYQAFANAYGFDVTSWSGYPVLRDLRELRMVATNARKAHHTPGSLAEVRRRITGLYEGTELRWSIL